MRANLLTIIDIRIEFHEYLSETNKNKIKYLYIIQIHVRDFDDILFGHLCGFRFKSSPFCLANDNNEDNTMKLSFRPIYLLKFFPLHRLGGYKTNQRCVKLNDCKPRRLRVKSCVKIHFNIWLLKYRSPLLIALLCSCTLNDNQ